MSQEEQVDTISNNSTAVDITTKDFQSSVEDRKNSVHSFRVVDSQQDSESDKDLIIHSLHESLHIHKEILERIQNEKEVYQQQIKEERRKEQESIEAWKQMSERVLQEQSAHCQGMELKIHNLRQELELKKVALKDVECKFYSYVRKIRVTDDDLSTIKTEIQNLMNQLNNTCMGLKSKMDRQGGHDFVFQHYADKADLIKKYMLPKDGQDELLDVSYITLFVEKYLAHTLITNVLEVPIHLGISINDAFEELDDWMTPRNKEWSCRLRQQVCALVLQKPGDEEVQIQRAKNALLEKIVSVLDSVYPSLQSDPKKIENLIQRTSKLNLAMKGQEYKIERMPIEEGVTLFDPETMKFTVKGKSSGVVFLSITPPFRAKDDLDPEFGFTVVGKMFCIENTNLVKSPTEGTSNLEEEDAVIEDLATTTDNNAPVPEITIVTEDSAAAGPHFNDTENTANTISAAATDADTVNNDKAMDDTTKA